MGEPSASHFLELEDLSKRFGDTEVLRGVSLTVAEGEILALLGPSGSGKTTILRLLAGFETADGGAIRVGGEEVSALSPARRGFGMVFQHYALFPHMTVFENVAFGLAPRRLSQEEKAARVAEMLELVDLPGFAGRRVSEISGGQQQRVALARALAPEPRLLLLDEPLSNLDPALRERTRTQLRAAVQKVGITTVLVTHEQEEAFFVGDRVAVLHRGQLEQVGRPEVLYGAPASRFVATFLGRASALPGTVDEQVDDRCWVRLEEEREGRAVSWSGVAAESLAAEEPVELVLRPEALRLATAETPGTLVGRVESLRFTGPLTYGTVRLAAGGRLEVLVEPGRVEVDDEVFIAPREGGLVPRVFRRPEPAP